MIILWKSPKFLCISQISFHIKITVQLKEVAAPFFVENCILSLHQTWQSTIFNKTEWNELQSLR